MKRHQVEGLYEQKYELLKKNQLHKGSFFPKSKVDQKRLDAFTKDEDAALAKQPAIPDYESSRSTFFISETNCESDHLTVIKPDTVAEDYRRLLRILAKKIPVRAGYGSRLSPRF